MARTVASLPAGSRITDYISLGVVAKFFPREKVDAVLRETKRASDRSPGCPTPVAEFPGLRRTQLPTTRSIPLL